MGLWVFVCSGFLICEFDGFCFVLNLIFGGFCFVPNLIILCFCFVFLGFFLVGVFFLVFLCVVFLVGCMLGRKLVQPLSASARPGSVATSSSFSPRNLNNFHISQPLSRGYSLYQHTF